MRDDQRVGVIIVGKAKDLVGHQWSRWVGRRVPSSQLRIWAKENDKLGADGARYGHSSCAGGQSCCTTSGFLHLVLVKPFPTAESANECGYAKGGGRDRKDGFQSNHVRTKTDWDLDASQEA